MTDLNTWVKVSPDSDFSIYNLPFGIFSTSDRDPRVGVAIGDQIIDLGAVAQKNMFDSITKNRTAFTQSTLNEFIALGKPITNKIRTTLQQWLTDDKSELKKFPELLVQQSEATMHMPLDVKDYTDFYSSIEHATNVGKMFRDPENALLPNWKHLPVGYHGRASSIVVSGVDVRRPKGQTKPNDADPVFGPCKLLDFELEMAFVVGKTTELGDSISTKDAKDHIFGMTLFNDWSARDIQKWEYIPLGPFLAKSFASSISPWIVTIEALAPFALNGPKQEPEILPYLQYDGQHNYDINLSVAIAPKGKKETTVCESNYKHMYWNMAQQLTHHTVNGCNVNVGDMMASGTISGPSEDSFGSMLELSWGGKKEVKLDGGEVRKFIEDGDEVIMRGHSSKDGKRVGFGEVRSRILPAK